MKRMFSWLFAVAIASPLAHGQSEEFGKWIVLFDGQSLDAWRAAKPNHPSETRQHQQAWRIEDGAMTNTRDKVNDLCTKELFENYELEIDYRIPPKGNSGVYLRGQVEIQIYDSYGKDASELRPVDAGSVFGGDFLPLRNAQRPPGEWNTFRVLHIGHHITVWHNGVLIQDNVYSPKPTGGEMSANDEKELTPLRGPLMLQGNHSHVWYRSVRIRPLFGPGSGWRPIWNGKDLSAFHADGKDITSGWAVKDHAFSNIVHGSKGFDIWTNEKFENFLVYYCYKSNPSAEAENGNSGFYFRNQWEIQIYKDGSIDRKHGDGALYSLYAPLAAARHGPNEWNHIFAKLDGMRISAWQNGQLIHSGRQCATRTDNHGKKTEKPAPDTFKIQGDHGQVFFSQLWIKPLPDSK